MKKQLKAIVILLCILILLVLVYYFFLSDRRYDDIAESKAEQAAGTAYIVDRNADDIQAVSCINQKGTTLRFMRKDGGWVYTDDESAPLNSALIDDMVAQLSKIPVIRDISESAGDKALYGLQQPQLIVKSEYENASEEYAIGDYNTSAGGYYLEHEGRIYIADTNIPTLCSKPLFDLLSVSWLPDIKAENVTAISVDSTALQSSEYDMVMQAYEALTVKCVENYKNRELYGFDGSDSEFVISYTQNDNTPASFKFRISFLNGNTYVMMQDEPIVYFAQGSQKLEEIITK